MRLVYPPLYLELNIDYMNPYVLVIEKKEAFSKLLTDAWNQSNGNGGEIIISEAEKSWRFDKCVSVIINPLAVDFNERKILASVYCELEELGNELCYEDFLETNGKVVGILDSLETRIDYPIRFNIEIDWKGIFKLYDVKIECNEDSLLGTLVSYIKILHRVCGIKVIIFANLKTFLSIEDIELLYKSCYYEEVVIFDIESFDFGKQIESEKYYIIDKDLCYIEAN